MAALGVSELATTEGEVIGHALSESRAPRSDGTQVVAVTVVLDDPLRWEGDDS